MRPTERSPLYVVTTTFSSIKRYSSHQRSPCSHEGGHSISSAYNKCYHFPATFYTTALLSFRITGLNQTPLQLCIITSQPRRCTVSIVVGKVHRVTVSPVYCHTYTTLLSACTSCGYDDRLRRSRANPNAWQPPEPGTTGRLPFRNQ